MNKITKNQYEFALERIEYLLPLVADNTPSNDGNAIELSAMSDVVIVYEKEHYPIGKQTVLQQVKLPVKENRMPLYRKKIKEFV